ncbi:histone deacetylase HDT1-like isoform X2 [Henckelia pumila]|uniref:histone deacetylase HDT1-like isoform X2 n=1 Tax=Henckelia pumila TaxID=405737 RepID=UPI003C6DDA0D
MAFWGVEVKSGEPLKVQPEPGKLIHISQAALGEVKDVKGAKYVPLLLKIDGKTLVLGSLSAVERTQMMLDLVIEREFELSHDWKNGSVYVLGYIADDQDSDEEDFSYGQVDARQYGNIKQNFGDVKVAKTADAAKAGNKKDEQPVSDEDDDDSESDDSEFDSDDSEEDSEDDTDGSFSSEEEPRKQTKKRPADSAREAPVFDKKAKTSTPNNTGNKKTVNNSIPSPSKQVGKGPASNKSNENNKKSNGQMPRKLRKP